MKLNNNIQETQLNKEILNKLKNLDSSLTKGGHPEIEVNNFSDNSVTIKSLGNDANNNWFIGQTSEFDVVKIGNNLQISKKGTKKDEKKTETTTPSTSGTSALSAVYGKIAEPLTTIASGVEAGLKKKFGITTESLTENKKLLQEIYKIKNIISEGSISQVVPYGRIDVTSSDDLYVFEGPIGATIHLQFDGKVTKVDPSACDGKVVVAHNVNGTDFYSEFCGVDGIMTYAGQTLNEKDVIGKIGSKGKLNYRILDSRKNRVSIEPFLLGLQTKSSKGDSSINQKKKEEDKKPKLTKVDTPAMRLIGGIMGLPFTLAGSLATLKPKKKKEDEENLNEEINRMKKLMK